MRVLVVDDHALFAMALQRFLERHADAVECAASGEEALAKIEAGTRFDLILCDQKLPGMSGTELITALRARSPEAAPHVVLLTGEPASIDATALGGVRVIGKPCDPLTLVAAVEEARARRG